MAGGTYFNDDYGYNYNGMYSHSSDNESFIYKLVYKTGLAKDKKGAEKVLLAVLVLAILGIAYFMFSGGPEEVPVADPFAQEQALQ